MPRIVLTGGGTAGHVTPNIALMPALREAGFEISYMGSVDGMEKDLIRSQKIPYYGVATGKLRRYFDLRNFTDPFRTIQGFTQARGMLKRINPSIVFSKGGFVAVPVVHAAASLHIPVVCHESDITPGLANKLCIPVATKICCNFEETRDHLPEGKGVVTGSPIRAELFKGDKGEALEFTGFKGDKPVLLIVGGSLGAVAINEAIRRILPVLTESFDVVHLCGRGKLDPTLHSREGYVQYEYVGAQMKHLFALADVVVSRAGANAICELLALKKPNLLIPLPAKASRGDQILNAASFEKKGYSIVLQQEQMTDASLMQAIRNLYNNREDYIEAMGCSAQKDSIKLIMDILCGLTGNKTEYDGL